MRKVSAPILAALIVTVAVAVGAWAAYRFDSLETKTTDWIGEAAPALSASGNGRVYFDSSTHHLRLSENGGAFFNFLFGTGSGTATKFATVSGSLTTATDQVAIDASGNLVEVAEAVRTFVYLGGTGGLAATAGTQYFAADGLKLDATESNVTEVLPAVTVTGIGCGSATAVPGGGKSWALTLRNGKTAADCALTCTISDTGNSCFANGSCVFANGDAIDWKVIPAGTPTASALTCFIQGVRTN